MKKFLKPCFFLICFNESFSSLLANSLNLVSFSSKAKWNFSKLAPLKTNFKVQPIYFQLYVCIKNLRTSATPLNWISTGIYANNYFSSYKFHPNKPAATSDVKGESCVNKQLNMVSWTPDNRSIISCHFEINTEAN